MHVLGQQLALKGLFHQTASQGLSMCGLLRSDWLKAGSPFAIEPEGSAYA